MSIWLTYMGGYKWGQKVILKKNSYLTLSPLNLGLCL